MSEAARLGLGRTPQQHPRVHELQDMSEIRRLLDTRRAYAAPAYSYLDPRFLGRASWYAADGAVEPALLLSVAGSNSAMLYLQGDATGAEAILQTVRPARRSYLSYQPQHERLVRGLFVLRGLQQLARMEVTRERFPEVTPAAAPIGAADVDAVNDLYALDSGAWISRRQLTEQVYHGLWDGRRLIAIAGTQMISRQYGLAIVANVLTHPDYRNRGYATHCVAAVTQDLLREVPTVLLNVAPENAPAIRVYERLGYRQVCMLTETWAFWRGRSWWDRFLAGMYERLTR